MYFGVETVNLFLSVLIHTCVGVGAAILGMFLTNIYIKNDKVNEKKNKDTISAFSFGTKAVIETILIAATACGVGVCSEIYNHTVSARILLILLMFFLIIAAVTDAAIWIIPNLVPLGIFVTQIGFLIYYKITGEQFLLFLINCALGAGVCFIVFYLAGILTKKSIGGGDIKTLCALGFSLGMEAIMEVVIIAFLFSISFSLIMVLFKRRTFKDYIPFAPYIYLGFLTMCYILLR